MRIIGLASGLPDPLTGRYVVSYDPDYHHPGNIYDGGKLLTSEDPAEAARFPSPAEALELWRKPAGCACHWRRADGQPNRPLTAYTVTVALLDNELPR